MQLPREPPQLPSQPPPNPPAVMAEVARVAGVEIDVVDSGGQGTMGRPDGERALRGPLAPILAERLSGSSAQVDAAGGRVTRAGDSVVDARTSSGA